MAINKNFVIKHGAEINTNLLFADADTKRVGIKTAIPQYTLDVRGGIGATDISISGIASIAVGVITDLSGTNISYSGNGTISTLYSNVGIVTSLNVSGVSTVQIEFNVGTGGTVLTALNNGFVGVGTTTPGYAFHVIGPATGVGTALYVDGDVRITGDLNVDDITFDSSSVNDLTVKNYLLVGADGGPGVATITTLGVSGITTTQHLKVTGISTFVGLATFNGGLQVVSGVTTLGVLTATNVDLQNLNISGIVTTNSLSIGATQVISSGRQLQNIASLDSTTTATIEAAIANAPNTFTDLNVTGISTLGTVAISSGIITAITGIVTYYGDGSGLTNLPPGSPGGSDGQIQYNSSSAFAGSSNLTFDGTSLVVGLGVTINSSGIYTRTGIITAQDFDALSDFNYKENINTVSNALLKVEQMRGVKFNWKESGNPSYGVIAQELQEILPELVHGENPKTVNYNGIIGVLIEAIKELKSEIEELKKL